MVIDNVPRQEMLVRLAAETPKGLGPWTRTRLSQTVYSLRRGVPGIPLLPARLPTDQQANIDNEREPGEVAPR